MKYRMLTICLLFISFCAQGMERNYEPLNDFAKLNIQRMADLDKKTKGINPLILITKTTKIETTKTDTKPPIFKAIDHGDFERVKELITAVVFDSIEQKYQDETPFVYAVERDRWQIAELLMDYGAQINFPTVYYDDGKTTKSSPLRHAIFQEKLDFVKLLLKKGADPEGRNTAGETLLAEVAFMHFLSNDYYASVAAELIKKGAFILERNKSSQTFLDCIKGIWKKDYKQAMSLIFEAFKWAVEHDVNRLKELCETNSPALESSVGYQDKAGNTVLHILAMSKPKGERIVKLCHLIYAGIHPSINIANNAGVTPLQLAMDNNDIPLFCMLVGYGADLFLPFPTPKDLSAPKDQLNAFLMAIHKRKFLWALLDIAYLSAVKEC